jgi:hypothetical protein
MSDEDLILSTDDAHITALELSTHILEYANVFRLISSQNGFIGRRRVRYGTLLLMMDEMGKLMEIMKDCERAVTMKDPYVKIEKFFVNASRNEKALTDIVKEIGKSETLIILFQRVMGRSPSNVDFEKFKMQFSQGSSELEEQIRTNQFYDIRNRTDHVEVVPEDQTIDMFFEAVVMNVEGATEFLQQWAGAKELDVLFRLRAIKIQSGNGQIKLWTKEDISNSQRNFKG